MTWTQEQTAMLEREYARIGGAEAPWPHPHPEPSPEEFLALLQSVPTGAGLPGYLDALRRRADGGRR